LCAITPQALRKVADQFPTTPGYDEATGIGSPKFAAVIAG
jgi:hypothetical protein